MSLAFPLHSLSVSRNSLLCQMSRYKPYSMVLMLNIQLAELSDWCIRNSVPPTERVEAVKQFANIVPLDEDTCLEGSSIKSARRRTGHKNFSLLDGLVLAAARSIGERLLTFDRDFMGEKDCVVLA